MVISFAGCQKTNATALGHNPLIVAVASMGKGGVCEGEDQPPWQIPWPLSLSGVMGMVTVASPGAICVTTMPRASAGGII